MTRQGWQRALKWAAGLYLYVALAALAISTTEPACTQYGLAESPLDFLVQPLFALLGLLVSALMAFGLAIKGGLWGLIAAVAGLAVLGVLIWSGWRSLRHLRAGRGMSLALVLFLLLLAPVSAGTTWVFCLSLSV